MKYFLLLNLITFCTKSFQYDCSMLNNPILIVVVFDGFKNEYLTRNVTPNLLKFRKEGVYIKSLKTLNCSNALQALQTIGTGTHSWKHGIVGHTTNGMDGYNESLYNYNSSISPIWATNQFRGGRSACMMWAGCEFPYKKESPAYLVEYNASISIKTRFETIVSWLNGSLQPPNLILVYIEEPDRMGHIYGPDSDEVTNILKQIDHAQGYLHESIRALNLVERTNIIYISDHGMSPVPFEGLENSFEYLEPKCKKGNSSWLKYFINAVTQEFVTFYFASDCFVRAKSRYFWVHRTRDYPSGMVVTPKYKEWNGKATSYSYYGLPVGQAFYEYMTKYEKILLGLNKKFDNDSMFGAHGYYIPIPDGNWPITTFFPLTNDSIFMAKGPAFTRGLVNSKIELVDFHKLFIYILNIDYDVEDDGDFSRIVPLLSNKSTVEMINWQDRILLIAACAVAHCTVFYLCVLIYTSRNRRNAMQ